MKPKVLTLFDLRKLEKRKTPDQSEFEKNNLEFLLTFKESVNKAHRYLHQKIFPLFQPSEMDKNLPAVAMISFIRKFIIKKYPLYCSEATQKRFKLVTPQKECIYLKKLDSNLRPCNIDTRSNDLILFQYTEDPKEKGPNIFLGYTEKGGYSQIDGIYAVCINGDEQVWCTDINTLRGAKSGILTPLRPKKKGPKLKEGIVKIKKRKRE